jgi:hypothetical protein
MDYRKYHNSEMSLDSRLNSRNFDSVLDRIVENTNLPRENSATQKGNGGISGSGGDNNNNDNVNVGSSSESNWNGANLNSGTGIEGKENEGAGNSADNGNLGHKMDLMALTNGWNDKNERIVISIGENAASYKWMHERSASVYKTINQVLSIIMIVFSTGLSAETIIPVANENLAIDVVRRIFTYIITLISVLQNFLKYEQLSEQHMAAAMAHAQLYHEIQQQMCMYRRDRNNATIYVASVLKQYDSLIVKGPEISQRIISQFKNTFKNSDISLPDIADRIQKIEIISEPVQMQPLSALGGIQISGNSNGNNNGNGNINSKTDKNMQIENTAEKRYGRYGFCNLQQIHNAFQIQGDITDHDIQNANSMELRDLRNKFLREKSNFEYNRYLQHNQEKD